MGSLGRLKGGGMRHIVILTLIATMACATFDVSAAADNPSSANNVLPGCRDQMKSAPNYLSGVCTGIVRTLFYFGRIFPSQLRFCSPDGANVGQAVAVVVHYLDGIPERWNENFENLAIESLRQAWRCKKE